MHITEKEMMEHESDADEVELPLFLQGELPPLLKNGTRLPSYIKDHRKRLRHRFMQGGAMAVPDYELLELVLFRAIPRRDVKPLACALLNQFRDFYGVLTAPFDRLKAAPGVSLAVLQELKIVEAAAHRLAKAKIVGQPVLSCWDSLLAYCQTTLAHRAIEEFRVLFLDRKNNLIADEQQGSGTVDHVPVYPREIIKQALQLNASALILIHNHPSGDPTPSSEDINMTDEIVSAASVLGLTVHDHMVIGKSSEFSFRAEGLLS